MYCQHTTEKALDIIVSTSVDTQIHDYEGGTKMNQCENDAETRENSVREKHYKVEFDGELDDEIFQVYEDAEEFAKECCRAVETGIEILKISNPDLCKDIGTSLGYRIVETTIA